MGRADLRRLVRAQRKCVGARAARAETGAHRDAQPRPRVQSVPRARSIDWGGGGRNRLRNLAGSRLRRLDVRFNRRRTPRTRHRHAAQIAAPGDRRTGCRSGRARFARRSSLPRLPRCKAGRVRALSPRRSSLGARTLFTAVLTLCHPERSNVILSAVEGCPGRTHGSKPRSCS